MSESRERICLNCRTRFTVERCPYCPLEKPSRWEYVDARVRDDVPTREPVHSPLPGSSEDYAPGVGHPDGHETQQTASVRDESGDTPEAPSDAEMLRELARHILDGGAGGAVRALCLGVRSLAYEATLEVTEEDGEGARNAHRSGYASAIEMFAENPVSKSDEEAEEALAWKALVSDNDCGPQWTEHDESRDQAVDEGAR